MKKLFISKKKLIERIESLEHYVGAEYLRREDGVYSEHRPLRGRWVSNPIAKLMIKEEDK